MESNGWKMNKSEPARARRRSLTWAALLRDCNFHQSRAFKFRCVVCIKPVCWAFLYIEIEDRGVDSMSQRGRPRVGSLSPNKSMYKPTTRGHPLWMVLYGIRVMRTWVCDELNSPRPGDKIRLPPAK